MWFTYCGASSDRVALDTFLMAVSLYLEEQLGMPADAVDGVLTPACREALTVSLDVDGNSEVCIRGGDMHRVEILAQPVISRDEK